MPSTSTRESIAVGVQEIELPSIVYADPMARAGVFHRAGQMGDDGSRRSVCKHVIDTSRDGRHHRQVVAVRAEHTAKFARPCLSCWPELRNVD